MNMQADQPLAGGIRGVRSLAVRRRAPARRTCRRRYLTSALGFHDVAGEGRLLYRGHVISSHFPDTAEQEPLVAVNLPILGSIRKAF